MYLLYVDGTVLTTEISILENIMAKGVLTMFTNKIFLAENEGD